jgi:hypothetical protein
MTMWVLVFLILWIGLGLYLGGAESYTEDFRIMNNMLIRDWLFSEKTGAGFLKTWFVILCASMGLLGINLIFCSWSKVFRVMRAKFNGPKLFMLIVHAVFGFVALGHLGGLMLGFEHNNIRLGEGNRYAFEDGYEVEVKQVYFVGDPRAFLKSRRDITRDDLDYKRSFAEVVLRRNGNEVAHDNVYLLRPLNHRDIHVTLRRFVPSRDFKQGKGKTERPRLMFTVSRNPVLKLFLALYPLMIMGIFIHLVMTWKGKNNNSNHN